MSAYNSVVLSAALLGLVSLAVVLRVGWAAVKNKKHGELVAILAMSLFHLYFLNLMRVGDPAENIFGATTSGLAIILVGYELLSRIKPVK